MFQLTGSNHFMLICLNGSNTDMILGMKTNEWPDSVDVNPGCVTEDTITINVFQSYIKEGLTVFLIKTMFVHSDHLNENT